MKQCNKNTVTINSLFTIEAFYKNVKYTTKLVKSLFLDKSNLNNALAFNSSTVKVSLQKNLKNTVYICVLYFYSDFLHYV